MPGSVCEADERILVRDYIYSVNGTKMKGVSHPTALQMLKHSGASVKIVILRDKETDERIEQENREKNARIASAQSEQAPRRPGFSKRESRDALIPGSTGSETRLHPNYKVPPPLIRHSTIDSISSENASSMGIPHLDDGKYEVAPRVRKLELTQKRQSGLIALQEQNERTNQNMRSAALMDLERQKAAMKEFASKSRLHGSIENEVPDLRVSQQSSLDENTEQPMQKVLNGDEDSDEEGEMEKPQLLNVSLLTYGKRSESQAFVIEYQRMFRGLGIKVMLDEEEMVMITEVNSSGLVYKDGNVR